MMMDEKNCEDADIEAYADGNLEDGKAKSVDEYLRKDVKALDRVFSLARLNAAIRKAKSAAYRDEKLSGKLSKLKKK